MKRTFEYTIETDSNNLTIERFLLTHGYTRRIIILLKKYENSILLNGVWSYVKTKVHTGDILTIHLIEDDDKNEILPVKLPFGIVYEDADILVVNKPFNMPIHPSLNNYENTLANGLTYYFMEKDENIVFRCINRLDRDTTGLSIIAKNKLAASILNNASANHEIHKEYLAICQGHVNDSGIIEAPIAREKESAITRCVDFENGDYSKTSYELVDYNKKNDISLVRLILGTGRTHQIRVHMKYIGHPLIGDFLYNPTNTLMNRQALHAYKLKFVHPITNEPLELTAPLPQDMKDVL